MSDELITRAPERGERNYSVNIFRPFQGLRLFKRMFSHGSRRGLLYSAPAGVVKDAVIGMLTH